LEVSVWVLEFRRSLYVVPAGECSTPEADAQTAHRLGHAHRWRSHGREREVVARHEQRQGRARRCLGACAGAGTAPRTGTGTGTGTTDEAPHKGGSAQALCGARGSDVDAGHRAV